MKEVHKISRIALKNHLFSTKTIGQRQKTGSAG